MALTVGKSGQKMWATFVISQKLLKVNNLSMCQSSPILVTLADTKFALMIRVHVGNSVTGQFCKESPNEVPNQGDQIGRIFAYLAVVTYIVQLFTFGSFFETNKSRQKMSFFFPK
jgi:hypothetical protein